MKLTLRLEQNRVCPRGNDCDTTCWCCECQTCFEHCSCLEDDAEVDS
jgi:hypothetical protein